MATSLVVKMQLKPDRHLTLMNAPRRHRPDLSSLPIATARSAPDAILLFVMSLAEARKLTPRAIEKLGDGGMLWVAYAKGTSGVETDVSRDLLWQAIKPTGWRPARQISMDEVWTAMRFSPPKKVRAERPRAIPAHVR